MSMTDPIADLLTRIRNGQTAGKPEVQLASSKLKTAVVKVLKDEGYIADYRLSADSAKPTLTIGLKYYEGRPVIDRIERAGYLERRACEDDGRGQLVVITERGKAIRRKMWPVYARAIVSSVGSNLSAKQAEALDNLLGLLIDQRRTEKAR